MPNNRSKHFKCGVICLALVLTSACQPQVSDEIADQSVRPARILTVEDTARVLRYEFLGRVQALQSIDVSFEVGGPLQALNVLEGQEIPAGHLIAALESTDFELAVREAQVQLQLAEQDLRRKQKVLEQKGIARSTVDDARSNYELQRVRLDKARESLEDSRLLAPFDAFVAQRYVDNRINIQPGKPIARLHDLKQLLVVANVPEQLVATATEDQVLDLHVEFDFIPEEKFPLKLYENRGEVDPVSQTYKVSMVMERPQRWNVLPGMTGTLHVSIRDPEVRLVTHIPPSAIVSGGDEQFYVWSYAPDSGLVTRTPVEIGAPEAEGVPVLSGLQGGQMIVANGASQLQPGMRVRDMDQ